MGSTQHIYIESPKELQMLIKAFSCAVMGIAAIRITIEVHITQGIRFFIVGLADHAIRESQQRIEAALSNNGFQWPRFRVVINLAPADLRKEGTHFDLPLAMGILAASGQVSDRLLKDYLLLGELSLDGKLVPVRGVLPMVLLARDEQFKGVIVPRENASEASVVDGIEVVPLADLKDVVSFLNGNAIPAGEWCQEEISVKVAGDGQLDFSEVKGLSLIHISEPTRPKR